MNKIFTGGIFLALFIVTGCGNNGYNLPNARPGEVPPPIACTQEAKLCSDGSAVGRAGPYCEFAACPIANGATTTFETSTLITTSTATSTCACPEGYYLEGEACNPICYKSSPRCLMPSIICTPDNAQGTSAGLANPASTYCVEQGGASTIVGNPDGSQSGNCILPNGNICDEWEYYRGSCK